jgi:hypothetical protein
MPALEFLETKLACGRKEIFEWQAYDDDGATPAVFAATDVVRAKLAPSPRDAPALDLSSASVTSNFSTVVIESLGSAELPASGYVLFGPADTAPIQASWPSGTHEKKYFLELTLVDDSDDAPPDAIKVFARGWVKLLASPGGNTGLTDPP